MPLLAMAHMLLAIGFAVHAMKTGRPFYWLYILIFLPGIGSIAYVLFELVPELAQTRRARRVATDIGTIMDPDREWRRRREAAELTDSVGAKRAFAEECERRGMWDDAISLYRAAAQGIYADDPAVLVPLARAELGSGDGKGALATLDGLRAAHPKLRDQEAHLVYARALEAEGRLDEAAQEYEALCGYFAGLEARARYGLLLLKRGEPAKARELFEGIVRAAGSRPAIVTDADRDWLKVAKANL
ncbi:MAG: tetratricopeptide repeat protein [Parvibaculaceae bacterium]